MKTNSTDRKCQRKRLFVYCMLIIVLTINCKFECCNVQVFKTVEDSQHWYSKYEQKEVVEKTYFTERKHFKSGGQKDAKMGRLIFSKRFSDESQTRFVSFSRRRPFSLSGKNSMKLICIC